MRVNLCPYYERRYLAGRFAVRLDLGPDMKQKEVVVDSTTARPSRLYYISLSTAELLPEFYY